MIYTESENIWKYISESEIWRHAWRNMYSLYTGRN